MNKFYNSSIVVLFLMITSRLLMGDVLENPEFAPPESKMNEYQPKSSVVYPYLTMRVHKNGRFWNTINNNGIIGNYFGFHDADLQLDGPNFYYPRYLRVRHAFNTSLWIGGVVNNDTLVSTAMDLESFPLGYVNYPPYVYNGEFWPEEYPEGDFVDLSSNTGGVITDDDFTRSQNKFEVVYTDTFQYEDFVPYNSFDGRLHTPLDIQVTQTSYSWSYKYAEDFMIVDYIIKNIGRNDIKNAYVGFYHVGAMHYTGELPYPRLDAIPGYIETSPYEFPELGNEDLNISWTLDVDGWALGNSWWPIATRNALGIAPLGVPEGAWNISFNWWFNGYNRSWGPRKRGTPENPLRLYAGDLGQPLGDKNKYYMMSTPEIDYNGYYASKDLGYSGWLEPFEFADDISDGQLVRYLHSMGPFDLDKGESKRVTIVVTVGENIHTIPYAYREYYDSEAPFTFLNTLDFSDLIDNVRWAKRIYDNPGVDTDFDGDSGKYFFHVDTLTGDSLQVYYEGDGVPDFRGATPPPPPVIRVTSGDGKIIIRWNGEVTENYFDSFSLTKDFEGYRIYLARSEDVNDVSLMASYDQEDYNRYKWHRVYQDYELKEIPFSLDSLRILYGDDFSPMAYSRSEPFVDKDGNYFYFTKVDYNEFDLNDPAKIHKMYPDAIKDTSDVDEEGRMRYYEYEYVIEHLLPTVPYYVSVTAFDFGHPAKSLASLESSPKINQEKVFAIKQGDEVFQDGQLNVYCYPNPYRIDADYAGNGIENRFDDLAEDRARSIFFANLPHKCTISIFSLDGDLVRELEHDKPEGDGEASIERFNLITRNTQAIETGLYYWVVESEYGNQIGKMAIIK